MAPTVSVVVPTFNRANSLVDACASVLGQSYRDLELIVVDDASSEDIRAALDRLGDDRVVYVRRPLNGGAAAARNTGLDHAQGEYVAFHDSDDLWLPGKLARQVAVLSSQPPEVGAVTGPRILYSRFGSEPAVSLSPEPQGRLSLREDQVGRMLVENRLSPQCTLFRRDSLRQMALFDVRARAAEDWDFAIRYATAFKIVEEADPVVLSFASSDSISRDVIRVAKGGIRILKNHDALLRQHRRQKSAIEWLVSHSLRVGGKPRQARVLRNRSLASDPSYALERCFANLGRRLGIVR